MSFNLPAACLLGSCWCKDNKPHSGFDFGRVRFFCGFWTASAAIDLIGFLPIDPKPAHSQRREELC